MATPVPEEHGCWSCQSARQTAGGGAAAVRQRASGRPVPGGQQLPDAVQLVANYCREYGSPTVSMQQVPKSPTTEDDSWTKTSATCRAVATAAGPDLSRALLGDSPEDSEEISHWLAENDTTKLAAKARLEAMNVYLAPKAVLVGAGTALSLADLAMFSLLHADVVATPELERAALPNLMRWFDYVQMKGDIAGIYKPLPLPKPKFAPPAPLPPVVKAAPPAPGPKEAPPAVALPPAAAVPNGVPAGGPSAGVGAAPASGARGDAAAQPSPAAGTVEAGGGKEEKKGKKEKPPAQKKEVDASVSVLDIRVGEVKRVWRHPGADTLLVEEIDIGDGGGATRQVVSGLANYLTEEEFMGRRVLVLANVKAGKVRDVPSSGLVLCASNADHSQCEPVAPPPGAAVGERVTFEGHSGPPEEVLNPKKKQLEKIQPDLRTGADGVAMWQDVPFMTSAGPCHSKIANGTVK